MNVSVAIFVRIHLIENPHNCIMNHLHNCFVHFLTVIKTKIVNVFEIFFGVAVADYTLVVAIGVFLTIITFIFLPVITFS